MPVIPTSQRQVRETQLRTKGVSARMPVVGATNVGKGLADITNQLGDIIIDERDKAEKIELDAYETKMRDKQTEMTHGEAGFYKVSGKNTTIASDEYKKQYDDYGQAEIDALGSDRLKEKASRVKDSYNSRFGTQVTQHTFREMEKYDDQQTQVNLESIKSHAVLNYKDIPVSEAIAQQKIQINNYADRKGISKEQRDHMMLKANSELQYGIINQAINNGEDLLAKDYYKEAKKHNEIDGDTSIKIEKVLHSSNVKGDSLRTVTDVMDEKLGYGESIAAIRKKYPDDAERQDASVARFKHRWNEDKTVKEEQTRVEFQSTMNQLEKFKTIDHLPEEEKAEMSAKKKTVVKKMLDLISKGAEPVTDPVVFQDLNIMASNPATRNDFLKVDINESAHKLSTSDRKKLLGIQNDIRSGKSGKHDKSFKRIMSNSAAINKYLQEAEVKDSPEKAQFSNKVMLAAEEWQEENGRSIKEAELTKIMDTLYGEVITERGFFFDSTKKAFELEEDEEVVGVKYDEIPLRIRKKKEFELRKAGEVVTEAKVEALHKMDLNR